MPGPASVEEMGAKVHYQVAAPELGGGARLFRSNSRPRRSPLCGCSAVARSPLRLPTTCEATRPTSEPPQQRLVSWHFFLLARLASVPNAVNHCLPQRVRECSVHPAPSAFLGSRLLPC